MPPKARTVSQYLAALPADRRQAWQAVRKVILNNLEPDYEEGIQYGMIGYYVPHRVYPAGYHCDPTQPLPFLALASQKHYCSLYLMCVYGDDKLRQRFEKAWAASGKRLNMGKSCVRFKKAEDLALEVISQAIRDTPAAKCIAHYQSVLKKKPKARGADKSLKTQARKPRSSTKAAKSVRRRS